MIPPPSRWRHYRRIIQRKNAPEQKLRGVLFSYWWVMDYSITFLLIVFSASLTH